jgi:oligopeptide transport system substrate-binding protein
MRICFSMDPLTIDPRKNGDSITSTFHYMIFDGLVRINSLGAFELALAESYEVLDDGKTYEFTLRDAYWSNGDPILAKDFENSWKRSLNPAFPTPCPQIFFFLRNGEKARNGLVDFSEVGVKAIGPKKLKIDLENPCPHLFSLLSLCNVFPAPSLLENSLDLIDPSRIPISGPFQIVYWKKREEIRLQKNPLYWDEKNVSLNELTISICSNPYGILQMFNERQIDLLSNVYCSLPDEMLREYANQGLVELISLGATVFCSFNNSAFPFNNKNIRKAFSLAIDREEIASSFEIPAKRLLPPPFSKTVSRSPIRCDREEARQLLNLGMKELGIFEDGDQAKLKMFFDKMVLHFENSISRSRVARILQKQWKDCLGIQVQLEPVSYQKHISKFYEGDYSMEIGHWISQYMDPVSLLERFKDKTLLKNYPRFENPEYSEIIEKISGTTDVLLREQWVLEAEALLTEEAPLAPLFHYNHAIAHHPELKGISFLRNGALCFTTCSSDLSNETLAQYSYG